MEFVMFFIEILAMLALLIGIFLGLLYLVRHRTRCSRWLDNYGSKENATEKDYRVKILKRKIEDAEADIADLEAETGE